GEMFFGGINGFNAFYPRNIVDNPHIPPVVIIDFQIRNEPVKIGERSPLKRSISETKEIILGHSRDLAFSFDFAALDFSIPEKNMYKYRMEGFDKDWISRSSGKRSATYTNLDHGTYRFKVQGSNNDGIWNKKGTSIDVIIIPPFWRTFWFTVLLWIFFAVLSYLIINFIKNYIAFFGFWKREKYIGKFKLGEKIGAGGMGTIFTARDTTQKVGTMAIKVLREELFDDAGHRMRFKQEAAIVDQLDHPNIVKVLERGQYQDKLYIVMELLKGRTLGKKIADEEYISIDEARDIMIQTISALVKIHSKGIVHRDLKPENIMLITRDGNPNFVKLLDFGLAKMQNQSRITQTGAVLGTISYMAPEQVSKGEYSAASDIYAMGAIFYETVTNRKLFMGERITDLMRQILGKTPLEPIRLRPDLPPEFNDLIMKMLEKNNHFRPTVKVALEELERNRKMQYLFDDEPTNHRGIKKPV
ncbi:MAG: protein kinase, partial [bacterium]|nr:protein kinase [bacterium]